jgi:uncharacterized C2H2 Zn-finger protein
MYTNTFQPMYTQEDESLGVFGGMDLAANMGDINIDPRLQSSMSSPDSLNNSVQPNVFISDASNSFLNTGQPLIAANLQHHEPVYGIVYTAAHQRSTTPLSQAHSIGSDAVFSYDQASPPTQTNFGFMSPPQEGFAVPRGPTMSSPTLLGLTSLAPADLMQQYPNGIFTGLGDAESDDASEDPSREQSYTLESQYPEPSGRRVPTRAQVARHLSSSPRIKSEPKPVSKDLEKKQRRNSKTQARKQVTRRRTSRQNAANPLICKFCSEESSDMTALEEHVRVDHQRPFTCMFQPAGCLAAFTTKNEWKRHINALHLQEFFYLCRHSTCPGSKNDLNKVTRLEDDPETGSVFNRRDLYESHIKRMHFTKQSRPVPKDAEWKKVSKRFRDSAIRKRCQLPTLMQCPAEGCTREFTGVKAWDERTEHIGRHMEHAIGGHKPPVVFGPVTDRLFWTWAASSAARIVQPTATGWELCLGNADRSSSRSRSRSASRHNSEDA